MATRREVLMRFGAVAGVAGAYAAARGLGLMGDDVAHAAMPSLEPGSGNGIRVVILGAGVAGLSAAYELGKAGYQCTILEARDRVGGRNFTVRKDTVIEMNDGSRQVCKFDDGYYFNAGPARIPSHHQLTLGYCREFGIDMETEVNYSGSARIQTDRLNDGKPIQMRQALFDYRGHVAEMLAKCVNKGALNDTFTADDREKLMATLGQWGGLTAKSKANNMAAPPAVTDVMFNGSLASGFATYPGAGAEVGTPRAPLPLSVVGDPYVQGVAGFADIIEMQATMQQPVGGMDRIPAAFAARLGNIIRTGCEVKRIRRTVFGAVMEKTGLSKSQIAKGLDKKNGGVARPGVEVFYVDKVSGEALSIHADYCICTIPLPVLKDIPNDFSADRQAAIARNATYGDGYKIAFQSPRFWERDEVYGGLSFTERDTFITWYPSAGFHKPEGVIVAGYSFDGNMGKRSFADQVEYARGTIDRLHPPLSGDLNSRLMKTPIAIQWSKVPYSLGLEGNISNDDPAGYALLSEADGPFYFAGEHLSHVGAWQQGAIASSHRVVGLIAARQKSLKA